MNRALWVLLLSGILGFRIGMTGYPDWQVAVETAQVVAGLVQYPPDNVFYIYHTKLWTALHQVLALALLAGARELTLSYVISGIMGMLTFQALAMVVYALSRDVLVSVGAAALVFFTRSAEFGVVYPVFLLGTEHTYGAIGLSLSVLVVSLLGAGWYRTGAMLLGMAPCIHPSLGVWAGTIVALAVLSDLRGSLRELRPALPWFLAGCAVTLVSLGVQLAFVHHPPPASMARLSRQDLATFVRLWDGHRSAITLTHAGVMLNVMAAVVACVWLRFFSDEMPFASRFLLRIAAAGALLALMLIPLSWLSPDQLPTALLVLMPGRYLNFAVFISVALLTGLAASRRELWSRTWLLLFPAALLACDRSMLWESLERHHHIQYESPLRPLPVIGIAAAALLIGAATRRTAGAANVMTGRLAYAAQIGVLGLVVLMTTHQHHALSAAHFADRTNDVFFAEVAAGSGVMAVAGDLHLVQLRTRRPVLADSGALDTVMYSLETGAAMQRILTEVYGLDLFHPPPDAIGAGRIPPLAHQRAWQSYSPEKWRRIRERFGVTHVLAYADWPLQLPVVAQSRRLLLYEIPAE